MKKVFVLLLLLCLTYAVAITAYAEEVDLSGYDDGELLVLLNQIQTEVVTRHIEKTAQLTGGTYIGGKDIPAGSYILKSAGSDGEFGITSLRSVNDPVDDYPSKLYEFNRSEDKYTVYITIEDGDTLILPYSYALTISGGVIFK